MFHHLTDYANIMIVNWDKINKYGLYEDEHIEFFNGTKKCNYHEKEHTI